MAEPPRYTIRTINDFLAVPPGRVAACLREFRVCLESHHAIAGAILATAEANGIPIPPNACTLPEWTWIDDGIRQTTIHFVATPDAGDTITTAEDHPR